MNRNPSLRKNLEQKFRCADLAAAEMAARKLGASDHGLLHQHDYFFPTPHARLKLRRISGNQAELISYRRADSVDARISEYTRVPIADADGLIAALTQALGSPRELIKTRHLLIYGETRIHLDDVKNLGTFVELEMVLSEQSRADAEAELAMIVKSLGLRDAVSCAYVEMLSEP